MALNYSIYNIKKYKMLKNIKIDEKLHFELKKYANENSLKLNDWLEKLIKREFEKIQNKNDN